MPNSQFQIDVDTRTSFVRKVYEKLYNNIILFRKNTNRLLSIREKGHRLVTQLFVQLCTYDMMNTIQYSNSSGVYAP